MDRFAAARLKIERANKHIADFEKLTVTLEDSYISTIERYEAIRCQVISYYPPDIPKFSETMALVLGDAIHNLRVAIDYAYLGAIERHIPSILKKQPPFPTGETREKVEERLKKRKIDILSRKLFDRILTDIKPYIVGGNCLVRLLHDLDVSDKHWMLLPVARVGDARDIVMEDEKGNIITGNTHAVTGNGPYSVTFPIEYNIKDNGKLTVDVVFGEMETPMLQSMPILADLKEFSKIALRTVQLLESV